MPTEPKSGLSLDIDHLMAKREELVRRLRDGRQKIVAARHQGRNTQTLAQAEERWLKLLKDYEEVEDRLRAIKSDSE